MVTDGTDVLGVEMMSAVRKAINSGTLQSSIRLAQQRSQCTHALSRLYSASRDSRSLLNSYGPDNSVDLTIQWT